MPELLACEQVRLLEAYLTHGAQPLFLFCRQTDAGAVQLAKAVPLEAELGKKFQEPSPEPARGRAGVLALLGVCKRGLGNIIVLVSRNPFRQPPAPANEQVVKPSATLPKQFDVCRETQVALIAGRIRQAQVLVLELAFPPGVQYALKVVYVEVPGKAVAYGTYDLPVLDGIGRVYQHTAEHLHVDASVEQLYQAVGRQARVCLEEHKGDFPFCRKKRLFPTPTLISACCQLLLPTPEVGAGNGCAQVSFLQSCRDNVVKNRTL